MAPRRSQTFFTDNDVATPLALLRSLNEFAADISGRLSDIQGGGRVAVLNDILFETQGALAVNTDPFPMRVQTPFTPARVKAGMA